MFLFENGRVLGTRGDASVYTRRDVEIELIFERKKKAKILIQEKNAIKYS